MYRKVKLLTSPQEDNDDIIELEVNKATLKPGEAFSFESWPLSYLIPVPVKQCHCFTQFDTLASLV